MRYNQVMDIDTNLAKAVHDCRLCPLAGTRHGVAVPALPGRLYEPGGIALIADVVTSAADSSAGRPFVGNRGEVSTLQHMLSQADLSFDDVLLMFRVRCAPERGKLEDYPEALFNCAVWMRAELEAYAPGVGVLMGATVVKEVFGKDARVTVMRGRPRTTGPKFDFGARVWVPTFHPYAASRTKSQEAKAAADIRLAKEIRDGISHQRQGEGQGLEPA